MIFVILKFSTLKIQIRDDLNPMGNSTFHFTGVNGAKVLLEKTQNGYPSEELLSTLSFNSPKNSMLYP